MELTKSVLETTSLAAFKESLRHSNCHACPLSQCYNPSLPVVSRGDLNARLMIVGEAPGFEEHKQGIPFVGRAGQLGNKMVAAIGLDTNKDIYWSNCCRCRPLDNRTPTAKEARLCIGYLHHEIKLLKPSLILCFGKTAAQYLLPQDVKATDLMRVIAGRIFIKDDFPPIMLTYHPAYLLRPGGAHKKPEAWEHMKMVRTWLAENADASLGKVERVISKMQVNPPLVSLAK